MELNLVSNSASGSSFRPPLSSKKPQKGSWKKRRRQELIQRSRVEKRLRTSDSQKRKTGAFHLQADEFSSGIDKEAVQTLPGTTSLASRKEQEDAQIVAKKDKSLSELRKLPNVIIEGEKDASSLQAKPAPVRRTQKSIERKPSKHVEKPELKPEAVSAALAIVGSNAADTSLAADEKKQVAPVADSGAKESNVEKSSDETFGVASFEETGLYRSVALHLMHRLNLPVPTKIQEKVLDVMLNLEEGQQSVDILVRSATGSGKTLAYVLPIAHYLLNRARRVSRSDGALAIIVVPTRELADQVEDVAQMVFRPWHWIVVGAVRGGETKRREKARLRKGVNVLVATPGRLLDHMRNTRSFGYGYCEFLVLDEADRLLDLGFEADVKDAIQNLDKQASAMNPEAGKIRSNILLSATLRKDVKRLADFSLQTPVEITVGEKDSDGGSAFAMPSKLRQHFCIVEQRHRLVTLACFLRLRASKGGAVEDPKEGKGGPVCKVIVFFSTCDSVDFHYELLRKARLPKELRKPGSSSEEEKLIPLQIFRIHGNHDQTDRNESLTGFRRSRRAVLFCTDVAARGLDLKGLTFSIQYDPPTGGHGEELEYLHRAGRTARIGAQGDALLFLLPSERAYIGKLESKGVSIAEISGSAALAAMYPQVNLSSQDSISYGTRLVTSALQESFEQIVANDGGLKARAVAGFQAYCRAYATHAKEVRYFFHVRNLHLGHVARAFVLGDKPAELSQMISELKATAKASKQESSDETAKAAKDTKNKGDIARAIAEGERQPYNDQRTTLARRRREKGSGREALKELASEFAS